MRRGGRHQVSLDAIQHDIETLTPCLRIQAVRQVHLVVEEIIGGLVQLCQRWNERTKSVEVEVVRTHTTFLHGPNVVGLDAGRDARRRDGRQRVDRRQTDIATRLSGERHNSR